MNTLRKLAGQLLDAYGALFLARRRVVGALILAATLFDPATGLAGLVAGLGAQASRAALRLPPLPGEADLLNAIYAGLALGAFYGNEPRSMALAMFGGALAIPLGAALRQMLSGPDGAVASRGLPLLGAPFLATAWVLLAAAKGLALPPRWAWPVWPEWLPGAVASALSNVGALFYVAHPLAGALVLLALLTASRALALLALGGSLLAHGLVLAASAAAGSGLVLLAAFNGALTALFIGGILSAPTRRTLAVTAGCVLVSTALSAALLALSGPIGIPPLSAPFVLTVWMAHAALRPDAGSAWMRFWLPQPARPEDSLISGRLAAARGLSSSSVGLLPPFGATMEVSQGIDGALTHRGQWRYALDFVRTGDAVSFRNEGSALGDFFAFDQAVLSPVWGTVASTCDTVADNAPGAMNLVDNWGNHVLIDIGGGLFVLLAHLRQRSLEVAPGSRVAPGTPIGRIGNSGRSAQPHLHLQVQRGGWLGAPTVPFHLSHCLVDGGHFMLDAIPERGACVAPAAASAAIAQAMAPTHGRVWTFSVGGGDWRLCAETGLYGESTLVSDRGARIVALASPALLALHGRSGNADCTLDAFILAFGLTPFSPQAASWHDAPGTTILPLPAWRRLGVVSANPFGANLDSRYQRHWDTGRGLWRQSGTHRCTAMFGTVSAESIGWFSESLGPVAFSLAIDGRTVVDAGLAGIGNQGDHGVPAWSLSGLKLLSS